MHGHNCLVDKQAKLDTQFINVWSQGQLFCKLEGILKWNPMPNRYFLPKHMVDCRHGSLTHDLDFNSFLEISTFMILKKWKQRLMLGIHIRFPHH